MNYNTFRAELQRGCRLRLKSGGVHCNVFYSCNTEHYYLYETRFATEKEGTGKLSILRSFGMVAVLLEGYFHVTPEQITVEEPAPSRGLTK